MSELWRSSTKRDRPHCGDLLRRQCGANTKPLLIMSNIGPLCKLAASDESGGFRKRRAYSEAGDAPGKSSRLSTLDPYRLLRACWWGKPGPLQLSREHGGKVEVDGICSHLKLDHPPRSLR